MLVTISISVEDNLEMWRVQDPEMAVKSTGKPYDWWLKQGFAVDFPVNQPSDSMNGWKMITKWHSLREVNGESNKPFLSTMSGAGSFQQSGSSSWFVFE